LPTVVLEALAAGRPVIGTRLGGIPYLVGDAGWLVPAESSALADILPTAAAQAFSLRHAARERYLRTFSPSVVIDQLLDVYRQVISNRPGG
jgi:glycosyltransferase involved in cell wall biosynthesis